MKHVIIFWLSVGGSKVASKSESSVNMVAKLLQVDAGVLKMALTTRLMSQVKQLGALGTGDIKWVGPLI